MLRIEALEGTLLRLSLDRPDQRNAVSGAMVAELLDALRGPGSDPAVRAVILSGEGPDFSAGADLTELSAARDAPADYGRILEEALTAIQGHPVPVVAQVQGAALGAGCQLTMACDLAVAAEDARIGIPSGRLGVVINVENISRLVLAVGRKRAGEILFTGRAVSGAEAASWGLVNVAVPPDRLAERTEALAREVAAAAPLSVRASKQGLAAAVDLLSIDATSVGERLVAFHELAAAAFASDDLTEGIRAFMARRPPRFKGS